MAMLKYYKPILFFLVSTVVIYSGVDIFYKIVGSNLDDIPLTAVTKKSPDKDLSRKRPFSVYRAITEKNIFFSAKEAATISEKDETEGLRPTSLNVSLLGTVSGGRGWDYAVIEDGTKKKQGLYKVGDTVQGAELKKILRQKVILRIGNNDEVLSMDEKSKSGASLGRVSDLPKRSKRISLTRADVQKSLENVNTLLSQARIQPHFKGGRPDGFRLSQIKSNSVFTKMGFKNGDIVHGINNKPIRTTNDIVTFYQNLRSGEEISLEITRRGRKETLGYTFE
ncbi:MAG: PDZ domain-containing protein [Deltaproteobacteria bacterium]|nr:PDZ domain-containing protein [Deltaproteobacteria bacterium]